MKRIFNEFMLGRKVDHVLFESEVKRLWELFHQLWRDDHYGKPCKGMTLKLFTNLLKKRGIIVTPARRKRIGRSRRSLSL